MRRGEGNRLRKSLLLDAAIFSDRLDEEANARVGSVDRLTCRADSIDGYADKYALGFDYYPPRAKFPHSHTGNAHKFGA